MTGRTVVALGALVGTGTVPASGQVAVQGTVVDARSAAPLRGALVTARVARRSATTDRLGRFSLWISRFPDTLTVAYIGRSHAIVPLDVPPSAPLTVRLETEAITLSDVIVTAPPDAARPLEDMGRWQVPLAAARSVPPAIETDVFRALALVPSVSFSTPLSSRPIIRGYDAAESSVRIDGFEILNLYHVGRAFSAFPADAASEISVAAAPAAASIGATLAGTVDITGQVGEAGRTSGGADLSLASLAAWVGGGDGAAQWFGAARAFHLSVLSVASDESIPYDFQDVYANALFSAGGRPIGRITAFASRDDFADRDLGSGMDWSNVLLGGRFQAVDDGRRAVNLWASANRFAEDVANIQARSSRIDVRNHFDRLAAGADGSVQGPSWRLGFGTSLGRRAITNRITPRSGDDFFPTDEEFRLVELAAYADWTATLGRASLQVGMRLDAAGDIRAWQPRARLAMPLARGASLGIALGRTARLYHLLADPQAEPELVFYDFWLNAGEGRVPVPTVDHGALDLDVVRGRFAGRLSVFASRARGLVELRPSTDQRAEATDPFRYGRGRTAGVELQLGLRGSGPDAEALSVAYVLSFSERDWGAGWVPWAQDRRHLLRLIARTRLGRWSLSTVFEGMSGPPVTPVEGVVIVGTPDPTGGGLGRTGFGHPAYVYGLENSRRSSGTARVDLAARYAFTGPWNSRMALGLSVLNVGFGPVAPLRPSEPTFDPGTSPPQGRVRYERLFEMPAVPSLTLRVEF